jgi:hypothetical protein
MICRDEGNLMTQPSIVKMFPLTSDLPMAMRIGT